MSSIRPAEPSESLVRASRLSYDELQTALTRVVSFASLEALLQQCLNSPECMEHMDHDLLLSFILGCPQFEIYNLFQQFMDTP
ncbi:MAG: hypothetical protein FJZ63_05475, partial [Chlamydiae bacterium]|nr:hypothetical protein [Chlamydiota bacterium]